MLDWITLQLNTHLIANGADIVECLQLGRSCLRQGRDLVDSRKPLHEYRPSRPGLAPDIKVGMDAHHDRSDGAACSILGYQVIFIGTQNQPNKNITCTHRTEKLDADKVDSRSGSDAQMPMKCGDGIAYSCVNVTGTRDAARRLTRFED